MEGDLNFEMLQESERVYTAVLSLNGTYYAFTVSQFLLMVAKETLATCFGSNTTIASPTVTRAKTLRVRRDGRHSTTLAAKTTIELTILNILTIIARADTINAGWVGCFECYNG
jgi:hypothetical protein